MEEKGTEEQPMSDALQSIPPSIDSDDHAVDPTILDRTILRPSPDAQGTSMDGETVLLDISTGRYYTLNRLGSFIWEHCTGHSTIRDIHAALCDRFDVTAEQALDDLIDLVNQLLQERLLQQERR